MNIRPVIIGVIVVVSSLLGWIIGRHTLVRVNQTGQQSLPTNGQSGPMKDIINKDHQIKTGSINSIGNNVEPGRPNFLQTTLKKSDPVVQSTLHTIVPTVSGRTLQVYSHNGKSWVSDVGICQSKENLIHATLQTSSGHTPIYIHNPSEDIWISKDLQQGGHWEGGFVNLIFSLLQKDADLQFIDLGANIGVFALSVAKLGRHVIAVEPLSINLQRLCKSTSEGTSANGQSFSDLIVIIHNALSDVREQVQLGKDRNNVGGTYVLKDSNEKKVQGSSVAGRYGDVVMTAKLDDLLLLPNFNFKKVVLKIDVEGYETKAFNGGQTFFDTVDVQSVFMEWRWHTGAKDIKGLLDFFVKRKYKPYDPKSQPLRQLQVSNVGLWPGDVLWQK